MYLYNIAHYIIASAFWVLFGHNLSSAPQLHKESTIKWQNNVLFEPMYKELYIVGLAGPEFTARAEFEGQFGGHYNQGDT